MAFAKTLAYGRSQNARRLIDNVLLMRTFSCASRRSVISVCAGINANNSKPSLNILRRNQFIITSDMTLPGTNILCRFYNNAGKDAAKQLPEKPFNKDDPVIKGHILEDLEPNAATKIKLLLRDYGPTVMVIHICISLTSLGICYSLVNAGLPIESWLSAPALAEWLPKAGSGVAATGGTFVIAYAAHKVLMPFRLMITATAAPLLVRYLRKKGILKPHIVRD